MFFNDTATTEIYTLSLHDALPIYAQAAGRGARGAPAAGHRPAPARGGLPGDCRAGWAEPDRGDQHLSRSEEHTSELQSRQYLVCRLLLEKKKLHVSSSSSGQYFIS